MSDDLSHAMRATAENLTPNVGKLTAGGVQRGVRRRRARRITQIAGAAASVTAVFGVVAAVGSFGSGVAPASAAAGTPAALTAATSAPTTPAAPVGTPTAPASSAPLGNQLPDLSPKSTPSAPPVSGEELVKLLKDSVAAYHFDPQDVLNKAGTEQNGGAFAVLKVGYPAGIGNVSVNISQSSWASIGLGTEPIPFTKVQNLDDGSHLMVFDGPMWPAGNGDPTAKRLDVSWYRTDGVLITVEAINEATEKGATTATTVPLTVAQATAIAKSSSWNGAAAAVAYQAWENWQHRPTGPDGKPNGAVPDAKAAKPAQSSGR